MMTISAHAVDDPVCDLQDYRPLFPFATLKAFDRAVYRSHAARDYACLLDLDPDVIAWRTITYQIGDDCGSRRLRHHVDFMVETAADRTVVEVISDTQSSDISRKSDRDWAAKVLAAAGYRYQAVLHSELNFVRVRNARDLLRYARYEATLGDRVRVIAALDEMGSLTLAECLTVVREGRAMETIASLILQGHLEVNIDDNLIGPDTVVRRSAQ